MINLLVIHCSATRPDQNVTTEDIRSWHKNQGWSDIGYHYVIERNGLVYNGRDLDGDGDVEDEIGAHAKGFNRGSISICMVGGIDEDGNPEANFTGKQWLQLYHLKKDICERHGLDDSQVKGHNELPGVKKACPSFSVAAWLG